MSEINKSNHEMKYFYYVFLAITMWSLLDFFYSLLSVLYYSIIMNSLSGRGSLYIIAPLIVQQILSSLIVEGVFFFMFILFALVCLRLGVFNNREWYLLGPIFLFINFFSNVFVIYYTYINTNYFIQTFINQPVKILGLGSIMVGCLFGTSIFPNFVILVDLIGKFLFFIGAVLTFKAFFDYSSENFSITYSKGMTYIFYFFLALFFIAQFFAQVIFIVKLGYFIIFTLLTVNYR